jgi:antirestriction protein ArdC
MPSVYDVITARIVEKLEKGTVPWHKPWKVEIGAPRNLTSGRPYRGINIFLLGCQSYASPFWGTYKQMTELGGHVRKGERGSPVVFWKLVEGEDKEGKAKTVPVCRYYTVFNVEQCEGINHKRLDEIARPKPSPFTPIERAEALVKGYPNPPSIRTTGRAAFYRPSDDSVTMPPPESPGVDVVHHRSVLPELSVGARVSELCGPAHRGEDVRRGRARLLAIPPRRPRCHAALHELQTGDR